MKTMKIKIRNITNKKGASPVTSIIIILILVMIFVLIFEVFMLYSISDNVHKCVERSIKTITTLNETNIYQNLRENILELDDEDLGRLLTIDELTEQVCGELGLTNNGGRLYKNLDNGGYGYVIYDLRVDSVYIDSANTLCFEATGKIDIPLNVFKDIAPNITVDLKVKSLYASKLRAVH